ncbi:hypothetical protein [Nocardia brasiliensis]|uniref:hypothetical protein n=1 Tax=Nocardia brasiliensis TaxID=37326 RepID=UPI002455CFCF|nr:hypothetical protein [Nocardia brasiliensis]
MKRDDIRPFLTAPADAISASGWQRVVGGASEPLLDYLNDWDQNTHLDLHSELEVDIDRVCTSTGLGPGVMSWSTGWRASDTGLVGPAKVLPFGEEVVNIVLRIPPELTGNTLVLSRRLVLSKAAGESQSPLLAHLPGSILWDDETALRLSGKGAAFPVEVVDFSKVSHLTRLARNSWYLDLPASVEQPVLGGMLLMVNSTDRVLAEAVTAVRPTESQRALLESMQEQVVELLVRWALSRWEELADSEEGSVGAVARVLSERVVGEPELWTNSDADPVDLHVAIVEGARRVGLGRVLS